MYKVFFNGSAIQIEAKKKKSLNDNISEMFDDCSYSIVSQIVDKIENGNSSLNFLIQGNREEDVWSQFRKCFTEIPAAGGLVQNTSGQLLFIKRLGRWDLPKGKIEENESPAMAAVREVEEECGLYQPEIIKPLESTYHIYRSPFLPNDHNLVLKETKWFFMKCTDCQVLNPQVEENIEEARWFDRNGLDEVYLNTYQSLHYFLDRSLPVI